MPRAEYASRSRCRVSANGTPRTSLIVSKTPSPTVIPWSKTLISVRPSSPLTQTFTRDLQQILRLELRLAPLAIRVGTPGDSGTRAEPELGALDPERADADRERGRPRIGVHPSDGPTVRAARCGLELVDQPDRTGLGRAGDRAGRESGLDDLRPRGLRPG